MTHRINVVLAATVATLTAVVLSAGVTDAHAGEAHSTNAADAFSRFRDLGLVVTVILVGIAFWWSNRNRHDGPTVADAAERAGNGPPHPDVGDRTALARTPVRATMTEHGDGPAPETR